MGIPIVQKLAMLFGVLLIFAIGHGCGTPAKAPEPVSAKADIQDQHEVVSVFELPAPSDDAARNYLGISGEEPFTLSEITAPIVIVEIFNMYCPHCQKEAPQVNELYQLLKEDPKLDSRMKLIGIAMGNTPLEVDLFREKYSVLFPLFPDQDMAIGKALGVIATPTFVGLKANEDGTFHMFYSKSGRMGGVAEFLEKMLSLTSLDKEL